MNTQQLESFLQVAETLSFARAAHALSITQSAVSRQVRALEEELGVRLFYRTTRTVALTAEGILFLEHARQILEQLRLAEAKIRHQGSVRGQPLAIGCESGAELELLCGTLRACREQIMALRPALRVLPRRFLLNLFFQEEADLLFGFRENLPAREGVTFTPLGEVPLCCVVPRGHPLAEREAVEEGELSSQRLILCAGGAVPPQAAELQGRLARGISPEKLLTCEGQEGVRTLVRAGYGCAILPGTVRRDPEAAYVPLAGMPPLIYGAVCRADGAGAVTWNFLDAAKNASRNGGAGEGDS